MVAAIFWDENHTTKNHQEGVVLWVAIHTS
jgi:hypothetical protein